MRVWFSFFKSCVVLCVGLFTSTPFFGQQLGLGTLDFTNPYQLHPAVAGSNEQLEITGLYRTQWIGFPGSSQSQQLSAHWPVFRLQGGVGITLSNDQIGPLGQTNIQAGYARSFRVNSYYELAMGGRIGMAQLRIDGNRLRTPDGNYQGGMIDHQDEFLPESETAEFGFQSDLGLSFFGENLSIKLSLLNAISSPFEFQFELPTKITQSRTVVFEGSYRIQLNADLDLTPRIDVRTDGVEWTTDLGATGILWERILGGVNLRGLGTGDFESIGIALGYAFRTDIWAFYGYDVPLGGLKTFHAGSHEIGLKYLKKMKIGGGIVPPIIYGPRFL